MLLWVLLLLSYGFCGSCDIPVKYNMGVMPFFANRNPIDSMKDATGYVIQINYDSLNRVSSTYNQQIASHKTVFSYSSSSRYWNYDSTSLIRVDYFDNAENDTAIYSLNGVVLQKSFFRNSSDYSIFENWSTSYMTEPVGYDSVASISQDSIYHYKTVWYPTTSIPNVDTLIEICTPLLSACICKTVYQSAVYRGVNGTDSIYLYDGNRLASFRGKNIYYQSSSSVQQSSSSSDIAASIRSLRNDVVPVAQNNYEANGVISKDNTPKLHRIK